MRLRQESGRFESEFETANRRLEEALAQLDDITTVGSPSSALLLTPQTKAELASQLAETGKCLSEAEATNVSLVGYLTITMHYVSPLLTREDHSSHAINGGFEVSDGV